MKKDKSATIRINSEILEEIKERGFSVQKIVDLFISENIAIETHVELSDFRCPCCDKKVPYAVNEDMAYWSGYKETNYHVCKKCKKLMNKCEIDFVSDYLASDFKNSIKK